MLCSYGCGREAIKQFANGKWCCSETYKSCPEVIRKRVEKITGRTKETHEGVRRQAEKIMGEKRPDVSERLKNGGAAYLNSFVTEEDRKIGQKKRLDTIKGRTKENFEYLKKMGEKVSKSKKGKTKENDEGRRITAEKISGSNHYNWNPDREYVFSPYTEEFLVNAPKVRKRDNYTCQFPGCSKHGKTVHHIDENKQDSRMENLITLCRKCHQKIHFEGKGIWVIFYQPYFRCIVNEGITNAIQDV